MSEKLISSCTISIIIKALNEERNIEKTITSALDAISSTTGEVILADSFSTDKTVEIAMRYPIKIVQLKHPEERCCGVGPQLGYQHSNGDFLFIVDGDMTIASEFLTDALLLLLQRPELAGVGGKLLELNVESLEYIAREKRASLRAEMGSVDRLDGGGLYRRSAIEQTGYFSDSNLHSYEEYELASRLRKLGWLLWRIPVVAVTHTGHYTPPYELLRRRWKNKYVYGLGELAKVCVIDGRASRLLTEVREVRIYVAVLLWWLAIIVLALAPVFVLKKIILILIIAILPFAAMSLRKKSLDGGVYAIYSWCINTAGLIAGFLRPRKPAMRSIASNILKRIEVQ